MFKKPPFRFNKAKRRTQSKENGAHAQFEVLEPRQMLAGDIVFDPATGIVTLEGSNFPDAAIVKKNKHEVVVDISNKRNSLSKAFPSNEVKQIVFNGRGGNDYFWNGSDIPSTANGNGGVDKLVGGSAADDLKGGGGDDLIFGRGGDDLLRGGSGADSIWGDDGNDDVRGWDGDDILNGGLGDDVIRGGRGNDRLIGEKGQDILLGQEDDDALMGGSGNDLLIGGEGADNLAGGDENDLLIGGTTKHDWSSMRLTAVLDEWSAAPDYASAVDALEDRDFQFFLRCAESVFDDLAMDQLAGEQGWDWFFDPGSGHHMGHGDEHLPDNLLDVHVEEQISVTLPHAGDPVRQAEHLRAMALVPVEIITHTAIQSGDWSDPGTWADQNIPDAGAHVMINAGTRVNVDGEIQIPVGKMRVAGTIAFDPAVDSSLRVETMLLVHGGVLEMGTEATPIADGVTATLWFTGSEIDRDFDPTAMGHGLMAHGRVEVFGQAKTPFVSLARNAWRNNTTLHLSQAPVGWEVGDQIVLAGTHRNASQDEQLEILAIDTSQGDYRITTTPLQYAHFGPSEGLTAHVANLTRNVQFRSEVPDVIGQRGHVMFMHSPLVDVNYAGFYDLGRSDKTTPLHDSVLDDDGNLVEGTGTNQRGRYAVHFHRHGVTNTGNPSTVNGSVVHGSPGWGFVNHSSYVELTNNVAYDVVGASFVTEGGDEIGTFDGNIAIRGTGSGDGINVRKDVQDFGHQGDGFWLQGAGVEVSNNIASGQKGNGFVFFTRGLIESGKATKFLSENLPDPSIANGKTTINVANVPLMGFHDNVAYGSQIGIATRFHMLNANHDHQSMLEDLVVWNNRQGLNIPYTNQAVIKNVKVVGNMNNPTGTGINRNNVTRNIRYENVHVEGYDIGLYVARRGDVVVDGGYFNNVKNIYVATAIKPDRNVLITGDIQFGTLSESALRGRTPYQVYMKSAYYPFQESVEHVFYQDTVTLNYGSFANQRVYYEGQTPESIPFPTAGDYIPEQYVGKTVQELYDEFGLAVGGEFAPLTANYVKGIKGLVDTGVFAGSFWSGVGASEDVDEQKNTSTTPSQMFADPFNDGAIRSRVTFDR